MKRRTHLPVPPIGSTVYTKYGRKFIVLGYQNWVYCGPTCPGAYEIKNHGGWGPTHKKPADLLELEAVDTKDFTIHCHRHEVFLPGEQMDLFGRAA